MKHTFPLHTMKFISSAYFCLLSLLCTAQNGVGINITASPPHTSAMLDVSSTNKGMLVPRMSLTDRDNISSPAIGLLVYVTTAPEGFFYYSSVGWIKIPGNAVTGTGTVNQVAFWNGSSSLSSNSNLFWDNTNNRLGVGTSTPSATLEVKGTMSVFGNWQAATTGTIYQAATDGFVTSFITATTGSRGILTAFSDANPAPAITRAIASVDYTYSPRNSLMIPVRKGDYWVVYVNNVIGFSTTGTYWVPMGN